MWPALIRISRRQSLFANACAARDRVSGERRRLLTNVNDLALVGSRRRGASLLRRCCHHRLCVRSVSNTSCANHQSTGRSVGGVRTVSVAAFFLPPALGAGVAFATPALASPPGVTGPSSRFTRCWRPSTVLPAFGMLLTAHWRAPAASALVAMHKLIHGTSVLERGRHSAVSRRAFSVLVAFVECAAETQLAGAQDVAVGHITPDGVLASWSSEAGGAAVAGGGQAGARRRRAAAVQQARVA